MDLKLDDKVVIVTGGTSGIGLAVVKALASEGAKPIAVARKEPETGFLPQEAGFIAADLFDVEAPERIAKTVEEKYGHVDGLVNNAAYFSSQPSVTDSTDELWRSTFEINVFAPVRLVRALEPALGKSGGAIVHIASEAARLADPTIAAYAASKTAVLSLSKSLAIDLSAENIRSNVVAPGPTRTALFDAPGGFGDQLAQRFQTDAESAISRFVREERELLTGKIGHPDNVADLVIYLLSPRAKQVTGSEWSVDGGALREI